MPAKRTKSLENSQNPAIPVTVGDKDPTTDLHIEALPVLDLTGKIHTLRGLQVMLDKDLAELYGTTSKRLRQQVKRNPARFPADFMFQITEFELKSMGSQNVTPPINHFGGAMPYVFTEQGVASLSGVLTSPQAISAHLRIMRAFVEMRRFLHANAGIFQRLEGVEQRQIAFETKTERRFDQVFDALEMPSVLPRQGIFYDGQIYDAHVFVSDLIRSANRSILLVDNYLDDTVLTLLGKRKSGVRVRLFTRTITPELALDLKKHNSQYPPIEIQEFKNAHDRFLILDDETVYHLGASLKDLGKKWVAFSRFDRAVAGMLDRLR